MNPALRAYLGPAFLVWSSLLGALALILCFIPLLGTLGYEFSLFMALSVSFAAVHLGYSTVHRLRSEGPQSFGSVLRRLWISALLPLALPLLMASLNALRVQNCRFVAGLGFFFLMPTISAILAAHLGGGLGLFIGRKRMALAAGYVLVLASLLGSLYRFYAEPPIFAHGPFYGYFSGTLYDEGITIDTPLVASRLVQLFSLAALLGLCALCYDSQTISCDLRRMRLARRQWKHWVLIVIAGLIALTGEVNSGTLGYNLSASDIQQRLGGRRVTEHFVLHYPRHWPASRVAAMAEDHEFRYAQLRRFFHAHPNRIEAYHFRDANQKRQLMGARYVLIAKPWRREVYLHGEHFPHPVLKHELAHVFAGAFGDPLFNVSLAIRWLGPLPYLLINAGLIEGTAVAADWLPRREAAGHQRASALLKLKLLPPLTSVFSIRFLSHASRRSYTAAGSFCRYLVKRYGVAKLLQAYRHAGRWNEVYGSTLRDLEREWRGFLSRQQVPSGLLKRAELEFQRRSIFRRPCPHRVALLERQAGDAVRLGDFVAVHRLRRRICGLAIGQPGPQLALLSAALRLDGNWEDLLKQVVDQRKLQPEALSRANEIVGDWHWRKGRHGLAAESYAKASALLGKPERAADRGGRWRLIYVKRWALNTPAIRHVMRRMFVAGGDSNDAPGVHLAHLLTRSLPDQGLSHYLLAKQLLLRGNHRDAIAPMQKALRLNLPDPAFRLEAQRALGWALFKSSHLEMARSYFRRLEVEADSRWLRLRAADAAARCSYALGKGVSHANP